MVSLNWGTRGGGGLSIGRIRVRFLSIGRIRFCSLSIGRIRASISRECFMLFALGHKQIFDFAGIAYQFNIRCHNSINQGNLTQKKKQFSRKAIKHQTLLCYLQTTLYSVNRLTLSSTSQFP